MTGKMKKRVGAALLVAVVCCVAAGYLLQGTDRISETKETGQSSKKAEKKEKKQIQIGVALYSIQNEYTKRFARAVQKQAEEQDIEVKLYDGNYDASRQNRQVKEMIKEGVDGILLIPQNSKECVSGVETAKEAQIPVISVNTKVDSDKITAYVGSNDMEAGKMVAGCIVKALNGEGNVVIIEGPSGQSAQIERMKGIKQVIKEYPDIHIIAKKTANWSRMEAKSVMQKWLQTFDRIDAVIAENDDMALGALEEIEKSDSEIKVVGIDGLKEGIEAVQSGKMLMTVFQDAESQSEKSLEVLKAAIDGKKVEGDYWIPLKEIHAE